MIFKKQISIFLLFSFSVLLGHNLVPHNHHAEIFKVVLFGACPIDHEDHADDKGHSMHCHAFNRLAFFNNNQTGIQLLVRVISIDIIPDSKARLEQLTGFDFNRVTCLKIPDKKMKCIGAISMRAPPVSI